MIENRQSYCNENRVVFLAHRVQCLRGLCLIGAIDMHIHSFIHTFIPFTVIQNSHGPVYNSVIQWSMPT